MKYSCTCDFLELNTVAGNVVDILPPFSIIKQVG